MLTFFNFSLQMSSPSKLPSVLSATDEEIQLLLAAQCHIGGKNCDKQMQPYVWKRRADGVFVLILGVESRRELAVQVSILSTSGRLGRNSSLLLVSSPL